MPLAPTVIDFTVAYPPVCNRYAISAKSQRRRVSRNYARRGPGMYPPGPRHPPHIAPVFGFRRASADRAYGTCSDLHPLALIWIKAHSLATPPGVVPNARVEQPVFPGALPPRARGRKRTAAARGGGSQIAYWNGSPTG